MRKYLGVDTNRIKMSDLVQCLARVDDNILELFHIDTKLLWGSGYVFNQIHNIMGNIPPEKVVAMSDAAYENNLKNFESNDEHFE